MENPNSNIVPLFPEAAGENNETADTNNTQPPQADSQGHLDVDAIRRYVEEVYKQEQDPRLQSNDKAA